jgi:hypothetical protein
MDLTDVQEAIAKAHVLGASSAGIQDALVIRPDYYLEVGRSGSGVVVFIASSKWWGNRNEIVLVEGFRLGNVAICALLQSRYSVESCFSQNARSAASLENLGIALGRLLIMGSFLSMHVTRRDHANQLATVT